jgi:hypothetical protein
MRFASGLLALVGIVRVFAVPPALTFSVTEHTQRFLEALSLTHQTSACQPSLSNSF